jgi:hypothetical protein
LNDWQTKARALYEAGNNKTEIARQLQEEMQAPTLECARVRVRYCLRNAKPGKNKEPAPKPEKPKKHVALENLTPKRHALEWDGCETIRFGLMGDTQINSKYTQLTHLHQFYDICAAEGIRTVFHTGDIDEGEQMRPGHAYECYEQGADDHVEEIVRVYPRREGITTYFITGNHDASLYKRAGMDLGKAIAARRPDMVYLGRDCAVVNLTDNCTLELRHPWDGTAYALSYKPQKIIEAMEADSKPSILAIGHYHKVEYLFYRNVHCFQTGCYQSQTPFTRGKGISVHMGGWIVEVTVDKAGNIVAIKPQLVPCYVHIKDDWKNWRGKNM